MAGETPTQVISEITNFMEGANVAASRTAIGVDASGAERPPSAHAAEHVDGTDDIQSATNAQKGVATAAHITAIEANTTHISSDGTDHANVALNDTHRASDGKDHSDVVTNNAKVTNATHTGDVTGATALTIAADAVTYAKMQNVSATDKVLGRSTAGAGNVEEIACTAAGRALLDDANATAQLATLGADAAGTERPPSAHASEHTDGTDDIQNATDAQKGLATAAQITKLDGIEALADVTDATNVNAAGATMNTDADVSGNTWVVDEDDMSSDLDTKVPTQQSVKAYVDSEVAGVPVELERALGDETTDLTTGVAKITFRMPFAMTLTGVRINVNTAPVGSTIIVDVEESGITVLSTLITIDASEKTSVTAATPPVISDSSLADDAEMTIDVDQIGSSTAGKGLKIVLIGTRT